jgi:hypothetical protein
MFQTLQHRGSAGVEIPFVKGLLDASASYADFNARRRELFQRVGYEGSAEEAEAALTIATAPAAYDAFKSCMETLARSSYGFWAYRTGETEDAVIITYTYRPPPGHSEPIEVTGTVVGGRVPGAPDGQVFPEGAMIVPNGSHTIQVLRAGAREMSVAINGGWMTAPPIRSSWREPPEFEGIAQVTLARSSTQVVREPGPSAQSGWTRDNHNQRCRRGICSGDGKWRASLVELRIAAPAGARLENPRMSCESSRGRGVCAFATLDRLAIEDGGRVAVLRVRAFSRPARFSLTADTVTERAAMQDEVLPPQRIRSGETVTFTTPADAAGAVAMVTLGGRQFPVVLGESSLGNELLLLSRIATPTTVHYVYRVAARPRAA